MSLTVGRTLRFALLVLTVGCAIGQRASFPFVPGESGWKRNFLCFYQGCPDVTAVAVLSNGEIELAVKSHNNVFYQLGNDYFAVSLLVHSKLDLTVDLAELRLVLPSGERIGPHGFMVRKVGPSDRLPPNRCMTENYFSRGDLTRTPSYRNVTRDLQKVIPDACYDLFFSTAPPKRGDRFSLDPRGFISDGRPYQIPRIEFD